MYFHKQYAKAILVMLALITVFTLALELNSPRQIFWPVYLTVVIIAIAFHCLVIEIDEYYLTWYFGLGFFNKKIALTDIRAISETQIAWFYGLGIRKTKHGWFYGVSGMQAVKIELNNGQIILLGTDDSKRLLHHLAAKIS